MIPTLLAIFLSSSNYCHTTAIIKVSHNYTDIQINKIVDEIFPSSDFVVCKITKDKNIIKVRYGSQKGKIS